MGRIKSKGTKLERDFALRLKRERIAGFKLNDTSLPGSPDFVFGKARLIVFLHGDFWHGWQFPRWKKRLKNRYWKTKIQRNRDRDKSVTARLRRMGWKVLTFWEHQLVREDGIAMMKLKSALEG